MITGSETMTDTNISDPILRYWRAWLEGLPGLDDVTVREIENGWAIIVGLDMRNSHVFESLDEIEDVIAGPARTLYDRSEGKKSLSEHTVIGYEAGYEPGYMLWVEGLDPREVIETGLREHEAFVRELEAFTSREGTSDHVPDNLRVIPPCEKNSDVKNSNEKEGAR
ncbi:hypothetical protein ACFL5T_01805 [Gemmatimonadota bacterium]